MKRRKEKNWKDRDRLNRREDNFNCYNKEKLKSTGFDRYQLIICKYSILKN